MKEGFYFSMRYGIATFLGDLLNYALQKFATDFKIYLTMTTFFIFKI